MALPCLTQTFVRCIAIALDSFVIQMLLFVFFCLLNVRALQVSRGSCI